jgi:acyl carrier protein
MVELTSREIRSKLRQILVKALGVEEEDVTNDTSIFGGLGVESIDWFNIARRLETEFTIKIPRNDIFIPVDDEMWRVEIDGIWLIRVSVLQERRQWIHWELVLGQLNLDVLPEYLTEEQYEELMTVDNLSRYIKHKLRQRPS